MAKRSPNYPSMTLEEAVEKTRAVYQQEHKNAAARQVVAAALGYNGLNGASLSRIAALSSYGLLEKAGSGSLKVSPDAVSILVLDEGHPTRTAALQKLAFTPKLFAELKQKFGNELPSNINLKHFLIQEKDFLPKAADEVIRIYRENLELVTEAGEPYDGGENADTGERPPMQQQQRTSEQSPRSPAASATADRSAQQSTTAKGIHEFSFPLSFQRDVRATITIYGSKLKRRDLEFLKKKVGDLLEGFEDEEPEIEIRTAMWRNKDHDQPVTITGELGERDGRRFYAAKETSTGIPEDELEFEDASAKGAA
jgi:hypothetical protein